MNYCVMLCAVGGAVAILAVGAGCEQQSEAESASPWGASAPQSENAAERYRQIHAQIGDGDLKRIADAGGEPTPAARELLAEWSAQIEALVEATRLAEADWGIDYSAGLDTYLPHLAKIRDLARLLNTDAWRAARDGELEVAAERLAGLIRMSRHVGGRSGIEAAVGYATLQLAMESIRDINAESRWNADQRAILLAELRTIDPADPHGGDAMLREDERMSREAGMPGPDTRAFEAAKSKVARTLRETVELLE